MSTTFKQLEAHKIIQLIEVIALVIMVALPAYYYISLPDLVPRHYGINGLPTAYAGKAMIWVLPILGIVVYGMLLFVDYICKPFLKDKKNTAEINKKLSIFIDMVKSLRLFLMLVLAYLTYSSIQVALGNTTGLGAWLVSIILIGMLGILGYFLFKLKK